MNTFHSTSAKKKPYLYKTMRLKLQLSYSTNTNYINDYLGKTTFIFKLVKWRLKKMYPCIGLINEPSNMLDMRISKVEFK